MHQLKFRFVSGSTASVSMTSASVTSTTSTSRPTLSLGASNLTALSSSSVSLASALTVVLDSPTVLFQPRERRRGADVTDHSERVRSRTSRERRGANMGAGGATSSTGAIMDAVNMTDYFGSSTLQNLLHNLHTGRSPLQFINANNQQVRLLFFC